MNTASPRSSVQLLNKNYHIACQADEQLALTTAAQELDRRLRQSKARAPHANLEQLAVMTALNLCHELQQLQTQIRTQKDAHSSEAISRMLNKIEAQLAL